MPLRPSESAARLPLGFAALVLAAALLSICPATTALAAETGRAPNIVVILADDLGYADCGFSGGREIRTPHLDKLAAAGVVLESHYVQPVCSPTRAALMTGRYPIRYGLQVGVIRPWAQYGLPLEERTLAQALREAGYNTAIFGKWHLGSFDQAYWPNARGFDDAYGHLFGALDYFTHIRDGKLDWYRNGQPLEEEGYTTHLLAREAVRFVRQQTADKPFFLYLPFNAVHTPLQVPDEYMKPYAELKEPRRKLAGMLAAMDEAVGQVVDAIDKQGLRENTLFVFSSDNGGYQPGRVTDNGPLRAGKGTLYEGGVRAAAFATWAGRLPAGSRNKEPLHVVDWYPTLVKLAGGSLQQPLPLDGRDIWPTLAEGRPSPHEDILLNASPGGGALRAGQWKLKITFVAPQGGQRRARPRRGEAPQIELYNVVTDVGEQQNVEGFFPEKSLELRTRYEKYASQAVPPRTSPPAPER
ncbi:MAG: arylsulfatase [Pirellulaceae bacterium]|nr:arylsulfatase [Pirellulaceae bacterium]